MKKLAGIIALLCLAGCHTFPPGPVTQPRQGGVHIEICPPYCAGRH